MTDIITRCPSCSASFRASPAQLQAADGQVRCGSCLVIFNAYINEIREQINEIQEQNPVEETQSSSSEKDELMIFDDMDISFAEQDQKNDDTSSIQNSIAPTAATISDQASESTAQDTVVAGLSLPETKPAPNSEPETETDLPVSTHFELDSLAPPQEKKQKKLIWATLSLLAILVLVAQYIYFHVDVLAANPNNHNWLNQFCQITGCNIPVQTDTSLIQSSQLVVHSHPTIPNALVVDAVIINQASFNQPFPPLALSFEDIQGRSVAKRLFQPEEYLTRDLADMKIMPSQQSVRLMLEVIDPGPEAVNYTLYIPQ